MPFPLAHPSAVLPLRRFCPRHLCLSALVIGSLIPDIGYGFSPLRLAEFSHRFIVGTGCFCVPLGLLAWFVLNALYRKTTVWLPAKYQARLLTVTCRHTKKLYAVVASLLIGSWTHLGLDSITHEDGWLVQHISVLRYGAHFPAHRSMPVYDLLYYTCTFCGTALIGISCLQWLASARTPAADILRKVKWPCSILLAAMTTVIASLDRSLPSPANLALAGGYFILITTGFVLGAAVLFGKEKSV